MFIQTEETPNPNTLKFLPGEILSPDGNYEFRTEAEAKRSPLAGRLFHIEGVRAVFVGRDFLSVSKDETWDWYVLKPMILGSLMEHLMNKAPIILGEKENISASHASQDDDPIVAHIKDLLDTRIRPAVAMDGGDVVFVKFEDGIVYLEMNGACSGCPSSSATLKGGIENMLKHYIPEVIEVRSI